MDHGRFRISNGRIETVDGHLLNIPWPLSEDSPPVSMRDHAEVFRGTHSRDNRKIFIKVWKHYTPDDFDRTNSDLTKLKMAIKERGPFAYDVYDFGAVDDPVQSDNLIPYIVTENVQGITVTNWLKSNCDIDARMRLWQEIFAALHKLHAAGITHGDPQPDNIMVLDDVTSPSNVTVKLIDFGSRLKWPKKSDLVFNIREVDMIKGVVFSHLFPSLDVNVIDWEPIKSDPPASLNAINDLLRRIHL